MSKLHRLTGDRERQRTEGLWLLARIITRHCLEHPERYPRAVDATDLAPAVNKENVV